MPVLVQRKGEENPREVLGNRAEVNVEQKVLLVKNGEDVTGSFRLDQVDEWWTEVRK